jgi:hypothetical protein
MNLLNFVQFCIDNDIFILVRIIFVVKISN